MKRLLPLILCLALVLTCTMPVANAAPVIYRTTYSGEITTLNYLVTGQTNEYAIAANVIDTLVEYDRYGMVQPSLAESWETSEDGLTWTFHLRKGAKWVDYQGNEVAEVVAQDFVDAATYVLNGVNASVTANILYSVVAGAEDYYTATSPAKEGEKKSAEVPDFATVGVKAVDTYTVQYTLISPTPFFLSMLTYVCFMPVNGAFLAEQAENFGTYNDCILYNGAFILSTFEPQSMRVYTKNASYWDKDNVFIDEIEQQYNKEASTIAPELLRRGEIDTADISVDILDDWLKNPETANLVRPYRNSFYTYFFALNFDPKFDAQYEPENWKLAVNNENFRLALFYGLDRVKAISTLEPNNPQRLLINTITPPEFATVDGVDYTQVGTLAAITARDSFQNEVALEYKVKAMEELKAAGATFPIKVLTSYNPSIADWDKECQVVEQQLEALLGTDFIDVVVVAGPSSGFLGEVRRSGKYALLKCNWGPDYADPETYTDPFKLDATYNFPHMIEGHANADGTKIYNQMVDEAKAIRTDMPARYEALAKAEAYLIDNAFVIPYSMGSVGYIAGRLDPFESQYSPFGVSSERYKGQHLLDKPMSMDEYFAAYEVWKAERAELIK